MADSDTPAPLLSPAQSSQPGNGNLQGWGWAQNSPQLLPNTVGRTSAVQAASVGSSANLSTNLNTFRAFEEGQTPAGHYQSQNTHFSSPAGCLQVLSQSWKTFPKSPHFVLNVIRIPNFPNFFFSCSRKRRILPKAEFQLQQHRFVGAFGLIGARIWP